MGLMTSRLIPHPFIRSIQQIRDDLLNVPGCAEPIENHPDSVGRNAGEFCDLGRLNLPQVQQGFDSVKGHFFYLFNKCIVTV